MSDFLLCCPAIGPGFDLLGRPRPLALFPFLGRPLLDLALADLAARGRRSGLVLTNDRPAEIAAFLLEGKPWGLRTELVTTAGEPAAEAAQHLPAGAELVVLDHLPGAAPGGLWDAPAALFAALSSELGRSGADRLGIVQTQPGVFVHRRARVSPQAHLSGPCWIGEGAGIGPGAEIGPGAIIEQHSLVDAQATVVESFVGPETYVGQMTELRQSFAWGSGLVKWSTGSQTEVTDRFLLAALGTRAPTDGSFLGRVKAAWKAAFSSARD
ncbi:MAG: hypothetical protein JSR82_01605 [Verrucomicrobia bacterium]|nr:hypothetical protein [Verrucomicrobiota bacterium]